MGTLGLRVGKTVSPPAYVCACGAKGGYSKAVAMIDTKNFVCFKHIDLLMLKCQTILNGSEGDSCHLKMTIEVVSLISDFIQR